MKFKKAGLSYFLLSIILVSLSCKKETGPMGPAGPILTGNVSGFVALYDQFGNRLYNNLTNSKIIISGRTDTSSTDSTGKFNLNNITTGSYNIVVSKPGFGSVNKMFSFSGGNNFLGDTRLAAIPSFTIFSASASSVGTTVTITGNLSASNSFNTQAVIFVGKASNTSANPSTYLLSSIVTIAAGSTSFTAKFNTDQLYSAGIASGQTAYISAYAICNVQSASSYEDQTTGQTIYTAISPTFATTNISVP